jgi:hypothetical protein
MNDLLEVPVMYVRVVQAVGIVQSRAVGRSGARDARPDPGVRLRRQLRLDMQLWLLLSVCRCGRG